jgi:Arc/MetJ-type ribon-helix-helix transcriptional regulator
MKGLHVRIDDADMAGLDTLVKLSDRRDRSYFVRNALKQYLHAELPKAKRRVASQRSLKLNMMSTNIEFDPTGVREGFRTNKDLVAVCPDCKSADHVSLRGTGLRGGELFECSKCRSTFEEPKS